jgi:hypothetical protein
MRRIPSRGFLLVVSFLFLDLPSIRPENPGRDLLALVPSGAQIVAGINASPPQGQPDNFLLITHNNTVDLNDFYGLAGADSRRVIRQIIFVAIANKSGLLDEHSLLASGHFDRGRIYGSAIAGGASLGDYHGISVLALLPFARERGELKDVRWLVVPNSELLLFGTITSVQQELDRLWAHSPTDPSLLYRLARMRHNDRTWCVLSVPTRTAEILGILAVLDPKLATVTREGTSFQFGIRYARQVELEYEVTTDSATATRAMADSFPRSLAGESKEAVLLDVSDITEDGKTVHGTLKVPISRYNAWLAEVSARTRARRSSSP